jgi:hypothetical protein
MTRVIVDPAFQALLAGLKETVELCDTAGQVLGHFTPANAVSLNEWGRPQIPEEELLRREREEGGRSLAEILADLEKRG